MSYFLGNCFNFNSDQVVRICKTRRYPEVVIKILIDRLIIISLSIVGIPTGSFWILDLPKDLARALLVRVLFTILAGWAALRPGNDHNIQYFALYKMDSTKQD